MYRTRNNSGVCTHFDMIDKTMLFLRLKFLFKLPKVTLGFTAYLFLRNQAWLRTFGKFKTDGSDV